MSKTTDHSKLSKVTYFKFSSELSFNTVTSVRDRLLDCLRQNKSKLLCLDFSAVKHCDSAGLALLIEAKRLCTAHDQQFTMDAVPKEVKALIEFCGVQTILS